MPIIKEMLLNDIYYNWTVLDQSLKAKE